MRHPFLLIFILFTFTASAQRWEVGLWAGTSHYFGDINTDFGMDFIRPAGGVFARENFTTHWSSKYSFNTGFVEFNDNIVDYPYQKARNLHFQSVISELAYQVEFNFFDYLTGEPKAMFTPYFTAGFSVFYFSPKTDLNGSFPANLELYGTEGQGFKLDKYSLVSTAIPFGIGIRYWIGGFWNLGAEISKRKTFTDYLDDVSSTYVDRFLLENYNGETAVQLADKSDPLDPIGVDGKQRGNSIDKDEYAFICLSLSYTIRTIKCPKLQ